MTELARTYDTDQEDSQLPREAVIIRFPSTPEMAKRKNLDILRAQISTRKGLTQVLESEATDESRIVDILKIKAMDPNFAISITVQAPTYERMGATFLQLIEPADNPNQKPTVHSFSEGKLLTADFFKQLAAINLQTKSEAVTSL